MAKRTLGKNKRPGYRFIAITCLLLLMASYRFIGVDIQSYIMTYQEDGEKKVATTRNKARPDNCKSLLLHEGGHWEHHLAPMNNSELLTNTHHDTYLREEISWLKSKDSWPDTWGKCVGLNNGLMYQSSLGNQCGSCGVAGFQPSLSLWVPAIDNDTTSSLSSSAFTEHAHPDEEIALLSPSLRLVKRLAESNITLCLAGDSIDYQFYDALRLCLTRQQSLQSQIDISISQTHKIPVNFTTFGLPAYQKYWMTMDHILETIVTLTYNGTTQQTTFRFFKTYAWAPWNVFYMDSCNIISLNLGLHYDSHHEMFGTRYGGKVPFADDLRAALTFLVDFVASEENRTAVWRSPLPQHFDTIDGHYKEGTGCLIKPLQAFPGEQMIQNYNKATNEGFSQVCKATEMQCGERHEHICTMDRMSMKYRTVYKMLVDDNCTEKQLLERFRKGNSTVTGRIFRWNIADIFDVPQWHASSQDCSHFCFVPVMYEAAFERLDFLLPSLD